MSDLDATSINSRPFYTRIAVKVNLRLGQSVRPEWYQMSCIQRCPLSCQRQLADQIIRQLIHVNDGVLQLFVEDLQAPVLGTHFQVEINGRRSAFLESALNSLDQSAPGGRLVTL